MTDVFTPPSGSPSKKPAYVVQYPDKPELGGKFSAMKKNSLTIQPPTGKKVP